MIVLGGINDIGLPVLLNILGLAGFFGPDHPRPEVSAEEIIAGLQQVAARLRASGLNVVGGTLPPSGASPLPGYFGPVAEAKRQAVPAAAKPRRR